VSRARQAGIGPGLTPAPRTPTAAAQDPSAPIPRSQPGTRHLTWLAAAGIGVAIVIIVAVSSARHTATVPLMPRPAGPLPVELPLSLPDTLVTFGLWAAALLGGGGVIAGLAAVARGARYPAWLLITVALVAVAALALLPPAGSADTVSYATYGRMALLGHNPYVMTPAQLHRTGDPIGQLWRLTWHQNPSLYGPLATGEQWVAAKLGGTSAVRIILWLKLANAAAYTGVVFGLDRLLRADPARRARAHLLWSVNPLVLWALMAGGHLDALAVAASLTGLLLVRASGPGGRPAAALAAGMLVGVAADVMLTYLLFAAALAWALRRSPLRLAAALAGICATLVPAYAAIGPAIFRNLDGRQGKVGADTFYQVFSDSFRRALPPAMSLTVDLAFIALAALMLWSLPDAIPGMPAVQPALAISIAWLFIWYYQLPWYDVMAIGLLAAYPASRLDWAVLGQMTVGTVALMPGVVGSVAILRPHWLARLAFLSSFRITPVFLLAALAALVWLAAARAWNVSAAPGAGDPGLPALAGVPGRAGLIVAQAAMLARRVLCCHSDRKVTSRHSEFYEHGHRLAAPGPAGCRHPGGPGIRPGHGPGLGVGDRDRRLNPDHDRGVGRPVQRGGPPDAVAAGSAAGRDRRSPAGRRDLRGAVGRGRHGRRRRHRRACRRGARRAVPRLAAARGRARRGGGVRRAAAGRVNRRAQLRHLRPDRGPRPQPVRDDAQPARAQR
jgi:hypothetical protein